MFRRFASRPWHYALLMAAHCLMTLPNLGAHTLWDMDEGVNAEAAREMLESGNWITPYYNYEIRTAKPVLLYWLQATSYLVFGVNEFAARFPAAVCGLGTVLLTYELGRRLFSRSTGLLAGLALGSCIEFCIISHAATPDAPLLFFTTLTFYLYWRGSENGGRWWFAPAGAAAGLAMLTKGPVGFVLPAGVIGLHLWVTGSLGRLWDRRALSAIGSFFLTAGPWYALVAVETRGKWAETFFLRENIGRFSTPMDSHGGGPYYHILTLILLFAPWSIFFAITLWHAYKEARKPLAVPTSVVASENGNAYRFLLCWFGVYLVIFSAAATKLPNYIVPLYPALAILTARLVDRWRTSAVTLPRWAIPAATGGLGVVGAVTGAALLILGGAIALPGQSHRRPPN